MRKDILIIGNFLSNKEGSYGVCQGLANQLSESDWKVISTSRKKNRLFRLIDFVTTIILRQHEYKIAHVDVFSGAAFTWAETSSLLLRLLRKRIILTLHGGNLPVFAARNSSRVRKLLNMADAVTVPSEYLRSAMGVFRKDLTLLPNPIDINRYPFRLRENPQPRLVWLRAFHQIYNPGLAIQVLKELVIDFPDIYLIMVGADKGDGSYQNTINLVEEYGLNKHIEIVNGVPKEDVPQWLNKGDIFINTTNYDNTPVSVIEAMACGLCVISTNVGGLPYLLKNEADSLLVPPNNPNKFSEAVSRMLSDSNLCTRISQNARRKVEYFDWSFIMPKWESLLLELIS